MLTAKERMLLESLEPRALEEGVEIVTVEVVGSKKSPTIRIYIDAPGGVSFDELSSAQAWIDEVVDAIDPFPGAYMLEVSSPGIDRPLRTPEHFERFAGSEATVKLVGPIDGRASYAGTLEGMDGECVVLACDGQRCKLPYDQIKRARLKGVVDFSRKTTE